MLHDVNVLVTLQISFSRKLFLADRTIEIIVNVLSLMVVFLRICFKSLKANIADEWLD